MRNYLIALVLLFASTSQAQSAFHLGSLVFDADLGYDTYKTTKIYAVHTHPGSAGSDTTINMAALGSNLMLGAELGLNRLMGIGVRGKFNSFQREYDNVSHSRADIRSSELLGFFNFHVLPLKHFDLPIGAEIGFSSLNVDMNDAVQTLLKGKGVAVSLYVNPRIYFGRFGINIRASLPAFNYGNLQSQGQTTGEYVLSKWKASGFGFSLGVQYKLF